MKTLTTRNPDHLERPGGAPSRAALGLATVLFALGAAAVPAQSPEPAAEYVAASEPCLNMRPGPSSKDAPVRCLPPGRRMILLESRGEWGRVRLPDDQEGWVALRLMKPVAGGAPAPAPAPPKTEPAPRPEPPAQAEPPKPAAPKAEAETKAETETKAEAEEAAKLRAEIDDLADLLRAAEMFISESEKQRLDLARQVAALQEENQALRGLLGDDSPRAVLEPAGPVEEAEATGGVVLPEAPVPEAAETGAPAAEAPVPEAAEAGSAGVAQDSDAAAVEAGPAEAPVAEPPAPAERQLEPPPADAPESSELMKTVSAWAKAWSDQRVEDYLSFYAEAFQPPEGRSRADWEAQRRQRVSAPSEIEVKVALRDVRTQSPTRVELEILQSYRSDTYSDVVVKTLELVLESGDWKIVRESPGS